MTDDLPSQKAALRAELRSRARAVGDLEWQAMSEDACERLRSRPEWRAARSVLF